MPLAVAIGVLGGCQTRSFEHGEPGGSSGFNSDFVTASDSFSGGTGLPDLSPNIDGNYPDPAVTRCGDVLGDLPPIPELASAWAVVAVPGATVDGGPLEAGSVLLRISQEPIVSCGDAPGLDGFFGSTGTGNAAGEDAAGSWDSQDGEPHGFEIMLAPGEFEPGVHNVGTLADPRVAMTGAGAPSEAGTEASIELLRVDDDCVIGIVRGLVSTTGEPFMEGGFVAQTCQRQCVPSKGQGC